MRSAARLLKPVNLRPDASDTRASRYTVMAWKRRCPALSRGIRNTPRRDPQL